MAAKIINVSYRVDSKELTKVKAEIQGIEKETKDSEREMQKLGDAFKGAANKGSQSFLSFKNIIGSITFVGIIAGLTQLGRKILDLGVKQEMLNVSFTTFLGSAERAKILLADLTKFSIITPFTPDQVNNAAKTLLAFGVQAKEIIPTLKFLGDVSSGTGKDLSEMAVIFGQIRSTGRLMGQDLLQLINAGFNPLQVIAEKTGKSVLDLKKDMENGLVTFDMVEQAFIDATSAGGLFFNLMEKQSATVGGKLSTIAGNIEEMEKAAFNASKGGLSSFLDILVEISSHLAKTEEQLLGEQGINLNVIKKIFNPNEAQLSSDKFKRYFNDITSLYNLAVSEIGKDGKEGIALQFMTEQIQGAAELQGVTITLAQAQETATRVYQAAIDAHNENVKAQNKETLAAIISREAQNEKIKTDIEETKRKKELTDAQNKLREARDKEKKALEEAKKLDEAFAAARKKFEEDRKKEKEDFTSFEGVDLDGSILLASIIVNEQKRTETEKEESEKRIEQAKKEAADKEAAIQRTYDLAIELGTMLLENALMTREVDTQSISDKYERELELAGDNDKAKAEIEKRREDELKRAEEKNKQIQKQNAIRKIGIDTAVAIIKTFAEFGYPAGIIPAALMGGIGIVQAAIVRKYKKGEVNIDGPGTSTSDSIPALLSRGESVINADATSRSSGLLEAINDRKIDDRILGNIAAKGGSRATEIDYARLGEEFRKSKESYDTHGYTIMKGIQKGKNFKLFIRSKVQGY